MPRKVRRKRFYHIELEAMDATSTPWEFYLAVTEVEKERIHAGQVLKPSVFSHCPASTFFKLFRSSDAAVREAMKSRTLQSAKAAYEPTTWFILNLHLTDKAVAQLFMNTEAPCIKHGPEGKGFRFFGSLDIRELAKDWDETEKAALGIDAWKVNALAWCVSCPDGQCAECKVRDEEVFKSKSKNPCTAWYCVSCWYSYMLKKFDAPE